MLPSMSRVSKDRALETKLRSQKFVTLCGRIFRDADPSYYPRANYRGRTILLCTDSCLGAFLADPDVFYKVHRNSEKHTYVESR